MIIEAILKAFMTLLGSLLSVIFQSAGLPDMASGSFPIPSPLFFFIGDTVAFIAPLSLATFIWWVWRQIKS